MTVHSGKVFIPTILILTVALMMNTSTADPVFRCKDKRNGVITHYDFDGYKRCALNCECSVYEHMCLERHDDFNFTLQHRSIHAESRCSPPDCLCNSETNWVRDSYVILKREKSMSEPIMIELPSYQELSQALPGSYEYKLI